MIRFVIDDRVCIGCGVSSSIAPGLIRIGASGKAGMLHQPTTDDEVRTAETAALLCPVGAISHERRG